MAALFIDLDGTCLRYHTNEWLPGVREKLIELSAKGHKICFITMTGPQDADEIYNEDARRELVDALPFAAMLITDVPSPRWLLDDGPIGAAQARRDDPDWVKAFNP